MNQEKFVEAYDKFGINWGLDLTVRHACHPYGYICTVVNATSKIFNKKVSKHKKAKGAKEAFSDDGSSNNEVVLEQHSWIRS